MPDNMPNARLQVLAHNASNVHLDLWAQPEEVQSMAAECLRYRKFTRDSILQEWRSKALNFQELYEGTRANAEIMRRALEEIRSGTGSVGLSQVAIAQRALEAVDGH